MSIPRHEKPLPRSAAAVPRPPLGPARLLAHLVRFPWARSSSTPRVTLAFWIAAATSSLVLTLLFIRTHGGAEDYWLVRHWLMAWKAGIDPYPFFMADPAAAVDYPPYAFLILAPLAWLPEASGPEILAVVNIAVAAVAAWQFVRCVEELAGVTLTRVEVGANTAMLLSVRAIRATLIAGQTMFLPLLLFVVALRLARRRHTRWAGLCFALASYKLNLAVGFGLVMLTLGYVVPLVTSLAWSTLLMIIASWTFHAAPIVVAKEWLRSLAWVYSRPRVSQSGIDLRSLLARATGNDGLVLVLYGVCVLVLGAILFQSVRHVRESRGQRAGIAFAILLWSLLVLPHQIYNIVLVVGVLWLMQWPEVRLVRTGWARGAISLAALAYLLPSVPFALQRRVAWIWDAIDRPLHGALSAAWPDRAAICVLVLFGILVRDLRRSKAAATGDGPPITASVCLQPGPSA